MDRGHGPAAGRHLPRAWLSRSHHILQLGAGGTGQPWWSTLPGYLQGRRRATLGRQQLRDPELSALYDVSQF